MSGGAPVPENRRSEAGAPLVVLLPGESPVAPPPAELRRAAGRLLRFPWIAVLVGTIPPAHLELALCATILVAGRDTRFTAAAGRPPLLAGTGWRLSRRLGAGGALAFWTSSRPWSAPRAARRGLVDLLANDPLERAREIRGLLGEEPAVAAWLATLSRDGSALGERAGLALERAFFALAFSREAAREGARAFLDPSRRER